MNANEIGTAKVTAISASLPSKIAKAQPRIPPDTKSCGTEPPIEIAPINTSSKPVSYTHLDVYKRQAITSMILICG